MIRLTYANPQLEVITQYDNNKLIPTTVVTNEVVFPVSFEVEKNAVSDLQSLFDKYKQAKG